MGLLREIESVRLIIRKFKAENWRDLYEYAILASKWEKLSKSNL